jgi:hypothetical protein
MVAELAQDLIMSVSFNRSFIKLVLWCSWLSLLSNTQAVPGSSPGGIILLSMLCDVFVVMV